MLSSHWPEKRVQWTIRGWAFSVPPKTRRKFLQVASKSNSVTRPCRLEGPGLRARRPPLLVDNCFVIAVRHSLTPLETALVRYSTFPQCTILSHQL
ncbi:uncharacterized protein YALI1_B09580g [Yarrowia lipolytica]|uniref:Uncharacterized protein n=1 Tax=Yarrowia lipolytica TaxID=4952 RepID=A0A1D8N6V2_YARLL|nr:hypothetical protein YALI1_B09580g [Yarrowia lipolytica]